MVHLVQRIIVNSYGWTRPSPGRLGPLGEGKYVRENGFGHEDWNFNLDLAIDGHIYGYAYYEPSNAKAGDQFQMAFVTYTGHRWHLSGFYFNAEFVNTAPTSKAILNAKVKDLLALGSTNSLGKSWIRLKEERMRQKLEDEAQWLRWKVDINNVMVLPHPVAIPEHLFSTSNYRITRPTEVDAATFNALRTLATRTSSPDEDDAFPEGREVLLRHKAKERSPAVVQAAKAKFLQMHGRFFCQACGFDFEDFYGEIGHHFIEAHHMVPVSELQENSKTKASDIALVCSNCHRMLHRRRPWIKMSDLKMLLKSQPANT